MRNFGTNVQQNALEKFSKAEYYTGRTYVCLRVSYVISIEYSAVGDTDSVSYGKPTSLADGSTAMATYLHENFIPLFLEEMDHFYLFMEVNSLQEIRLFCKNCKKSLHMSYILTNDGDTPVLPNVAIKCTCCKRVLMLKKYTEKKLLEHAVSDRFYI